jgi:hypothetical protein
MAGKIFSTPWRPGFPAHSAGGKEPTGWKFGANLKDLKHWSSFTTKNPASLSANSWPMHCISCFNNGKVHENGTNYAGTACEWTIHERCGIYFRGGSRIQPSLRPKFIGIIAPEVMATV